MSEPLPPGATRWLLHEDLYPFACLLVVHIHDLIAASSLYFGEGATMASEAAVMGVPSIFISTLRLGYLNELQLKYGLAFSFDSRAEAVPKAEELLTDPGAGHAWEKKRSKMLNDKIDVTEFITELILNYPGSVERYRTGEE